MVDIIKERSERRLVKIRLIADTIINEMEKGNPIPFEQFIIQCCHVHNIAPRTSREYIEVAMSIAETKLRDGDIVPRESYFKTPEHRVDSKTNIKESDIQKELKEILGDENNIHKNTGGKK